MREKLIAMILGAQGTRLSNYMPRSQDNIREAADQWLDEFFQAETPAEVGSAFDVWAKNNGLNWDVSFCPNGGYAEEYVGTAYLAWQQQQQIIDALRAQVNECMEIIEDMVNEEVEYATINNLSGVENKHNIKRARAALTKESKHGK